MSKLYIICGHGAGDPGACAAGQTEEERVRYLASRIKALGGDQVVILDTSRNWYADNGISSLSIPKGDMLLELHRDSAATSARGAHVIIYSGFDADSFDKTLSEGLSQILPGRSEIIKKRSDLANPKRAAVCGINYRLAEVGFITNEEDRRIFDTRTDEIASIILKAAGLNVFPTAGAPDQSQASTNVTPSESTSSNFGGTYTCTVNHLQIRTGPGTNYDIVRGKDGNPVYYNKGMTVVLDDWYKSANGYIWGRYTGNSGNVRYIAVGRATGKPESDDFLVKI